MIVFIVTYIEMGQIGVMGLPAPEVRYVMDNGLMGGVGYYFVSYSLRTYGDSVVYRKGGTLGFMSLGFGKRFYEDANISPAVYAALGYAESSTEDGDNMDVTVLSIHLRFFISPFYRSKRRLRDLGIDTDISGFYLHYGSGNGEVETGDLILIPLPSMGIFYRWR